MINSQPNGFQVGIRRKPSGLKSGVSDLAVNDDVKLAAASGLYVHRSMATRLKPSLHTEGFGFVASGGAVKDENLRDNPLR